METLHLLRRKFSAGHAHQPCGERPHGHDYEVIVGVRDFPIGAADQLNDLLVQTYSAEHLTGRIGFIVQDGQGTFEHPKAWEMSLP